MTAGASFNPLEPRDRNGRWTAGMPSVISRHDLEVDGGKIGIEANAKDPSDSVRVTIGDQSQTLTKADIRGVRSAIVSAQYDHQRKLGNFSVGAVGKEVVDGETLAAGVEVKLRGASIRMSRHQSDKFIDEMENAAAADRVETGYGPLDVFVTGGSSTKRLGFRMRSENGHAEVTFSEAEWTRVSEAVNTVEDGADFAGNKVKGPLKVKTAAGPVQVSWRGERQANGFNPDSSLIIEPLYKADWGMAFSGAQIIQAFTPIQIAEDYAGIRG